jgi:hypothetical protein
MVMKRCCITSAWSGLLENLVFTRIQFKPIEVRAANLISYKNNRSMRQMLKTLFWTREVAHITQEIAKGIPSHEVS